MVLLFLRGYILGTGFIKPKFDDVGYHLFWILWKSEGVLLDARPYEHSLVLKVWNKYSKTLIN